MIYKYRFKHNGFTLIEILLSILIFSMVSFALFQLVQQVFNTEKVVKLKTKELNQLQLVFNFKMRDYEQIINRSIRDSQENNLSPAFIVTKDISENSIVEFTKTGWNNPDMLFPRSYLQRVKWYVEDNQLKRGYWLYPDRLNNKYYYEEVMLKEVKNFLIQFYDKNIWLDTTENQNLNIIPKLIKVEITLQNNLTIEWLFVTPYDKEEEKV